MGGSEVWVYRGSRLRSPLVPVVLSVYQRGSLLDGLAVYLSCDTKKLHDNESTHILHNFWTSTHRGEASPPRGGATASTTQTWLRRKRIGKRLPQRCGTGERACIYLLSTRVPVSPEIQ